MRKEKIILNQINGGLVKQGQKMAGGRRGNRDSSGRRTSYLMVVDESRVPTFSPFMSHECQRRKPRTN
eukprot:scaffold2563_cov124-Cylindrotheca_fusiformis.AAC.30